MNTEIPTPAEQRGDERSPEVVLTIAGLDPSSGAGMTADLKTFAAHRLYGICCPTALTVQSTRGVRRVTPIEAALMVATLACLAEDTPPSGIKIGMLGNAAIASAVSDFLSTAATMQNAIVLDPVLRSSSGAVLLDEEGLGVVRERLLGQVGWITPNIDELAVLLDEPVADANGIPAQADRLQQLAAGAGNCQLRVIVTGGHLDRPDDFFLDCLDVPKDPDQPGVWLRGQRVDTRSTHGTGCAFSSSLVSQVVLGHGGEKAVARAKAYVAGALRHAYPIGRGKGPMNHFFEFW